MTQEQIKNQIADLKDKLSMIRRGYDTSNPKPIIRRIKDLKKSIQKEIKENDIQRY